MSSVGEVGVIPRIAAILGMLQEAPMTAAELTTRLGYSSSTGYRLLADLRRYGFIVRDAGGVLRLGPFPGSSRMATTTSVLERLRTEADESAQLWLRAGEDRICVRTAEADHELRVSRSVGAVLPLVDGGSGALALCGPGNPREFYVTKQGRITGVGSASVAFTVGHSVLALCISFPLSRAPENVVGAYRTILTEAAGELTGVLEYSEELGVLHDIAGLAIGARR